MTYQNSGTKIALAVIVVLVVVLGAAVYFNPISGQQPLSQSAVEEIGTETCHDTFGQEWSYSGHVRTHDPTVMCSGPNEKDGFVPMPKAMQDELNMVIANGSGVGA